MKIARCDVSVFLKSKQYKYLATKLYLLVVQATSLLIQSFTLTSLGAAIVVLSRASVIRLEAG